MMEFLRRNDGRNLAIFGAVWFTAMAVVITVTTALAHPDTRPLLFVALALLWYSAGGVSGAAVGHLSKSGKT